MKKYKYIKWNHQSWSIFKCDGLKLIQYLKLHGWNKQQISKSLNISEGQIGYFLKTYNKTTFKDLKNPSKLNKLNKLNKKLSSTYIKAVAEVLRNRDE